jgi:hypothetical protein
MDIYRNEIQLEYLNKLLLNDIHLRKEIRKLPLETLKIHTGLLAYLDKCDYSSVYKDLCKRFPEIRNVKVKKLRKTCSKSADVQGDDSSNNLNLYYDLKVDSCQTSETLIESNLTSKLNIENDRAQKSNSTSSVPNLKVSDTNSKSVSLSEIEELLNRNWANLINAKSENTEDTSLHKVTNKVKDASIICKSNIDVDKNIKNDHQNNDNFSSLYPVESIVPRVRFELVKKIISKPAKVQILKSTRQNNKKQEKAMYQKEQHKNTNNSNNSRLYRMFKLNTRHFKHGRHVRREFYYTID